jgi:hypothetical protein
VLNGPSIDVRGPRGRRRRTVALEIEVKPEPSQRHVVIMSHPLLPGRRPTRAASVSSRLTAIPPTLRQLPLRGPPKAFRASGSRSVLRRTCRTRRTPSRSPGAGGCGSNRSGDRRGRGERLEGHRQLPPARGVKRAGSAMAPQAVACAAERDRPPRVSSPEEGFVGFVCVANDSAVVFDPADARRAPMDPTGTLRHRSG